MRLLLLFKFFDKADERNADDFLDNDSGSRAHMNENHYYRRSFIKRGLALVGGVFFLGAGRLGLAATQPAEIVKAKRVVKGRGTARHCIEGVILDAP